MSFTSEKTDGCSDCITGLAEGYEEIRRDALGIDTLARPGLGLALFMSRGMAAWMAAWPPRMCRHDGASTSRGEQPEFVPQGLHSEVATILAGMALSASPRVRA